MKNLCAHSNKPRGFSLVENLVSLCVVALILPTTLAALTLSLDFKRKASQESKLIQVAAYVFSEMPFAWNDETGIFFPSNAPRPFPSISSGESLSILFTSEAKPYASDGVLNRGDRSWSLKNPDIPLTSPQEVASGYIATIVAAPNDTLGKDPMRTERFKLTIEYPAGAPSSSRKSSTYYRLYSAP